MATLVLDASVFLSWLFPDEENEWSKQLVRDLGEEDRVVVPAHWLVEIANALLVGSRRKRIKTEQMLRFWVSWLLSQSRLNRHCRSKTRSASQHSAQSIL